MIYKKILIVPLGHDDAMSLQRLRYLWRAFHYRRRVNREEIEFLAGQVRPGRYWDAKHYYNNFAFLPKASKA